MLKRFFALLFLVVAATGAQAQENRIAAVVNSEIITADDLSARMSLVMRSSDIQDTPENRQRLAPRLLRQLIDEKLQMQEAKRLNVTVSKEESDEALAGIEQRNNMPKNGLTDYLKRAGIPKSTLIDQLTASLAWAKVVRNRFSPEVTVSTEEINESMAEIKSEEGKPQSHVAEIFLAVDNPAQDDEVHRLADRLIEQIRGGANFSAVAQQFSQAPSAAVGGDIGWLTPSQLGPQLDSAIEKMKPGEMSFPQRTPAGYYVLYVIARRTFGAADVNQTKLTLVEVAFPLGPSATAADRQRVTNEALQLSGDTKSCGELAKFGRDHGLPTQNGDVIAGNLPPEFRPQVLALKIAEASKPIALSEGKGVGVFMVCQREDPQGGMPTRDEVANNLARERLDALARRYLRDLRRAAYLDIRA
ncbi:MAG TPA: peptidylprolyl isomerase [Stellaceae bacterium]|nr:peptidylprolyl isomerase [Stellaceae bacterium]